MPRYARPSATRTVEAAIETFGNRVRVAIIGYLGDHEAADVSEIAQEIQASPATVHHHLRKLEDLGLVSTDPSEPAKRNGVKILYSRNAIELRTLYEQLGRASRLDPLQK